MLQRHCVGAPLCGRPMTCALFKEFRATTQGFPYNSPVTQSSICRTRCPHCAVSSSFVPRRVGHDALGVPRCLLRKTRAGAMWASLPTKYIRHPAIILSTDKSPAPISRPRFLRSLDSMPTEVGLIIDSPPHPNTKNRPRLLPLPVFTYRNIFYLTCPFP